MELDALKEAALQARLRAHAPFSNFQVGAALQAQDGRIFGGCNVENSSYGLTMCAERTAIFRAVAEGAKRFTRIAIVADTEKLTPPCGACRQVLWDLCGDLEVILFNPQGETETCRLRDLLPRAFDATFLD
ncbi:cytidine deaminase [Paludibaculum fermentans]|uniref:Cytidine deaminase n=1 Tax=Paludibaculum fermentans TaxID=1473598 RepID=A0A7S7NTK3_PALFE|nr:cytidine deaminase [Paludibaculum fermentans]QOY89488.1 cytidine deaminase [Paludibaculum fermentans]